MYKIDCNGKTKEYNAKGVRIDQGSIMFFSDEECTLVTAIVPQGKWDSFEVMEGTEPLVNKVGKKEEETSKEEEN